MVLGGPLRGPWRSLEELWDSLGVRGVCLGGARESLEVPWQALEISEKPLICITIFRNKRTLEQLLGTLGRHLGSLL